MTMLITGTGCSGTHYIRRVLQRCGLNIGHEDESHEYQHNVSWRHAHRSGEWDVTLYQLRDFRKAATGIMTRWHQRAWSFADRVLRQWWGVSLRTPYDYHCLHNAVTEVWWWHRICQKVCDAQYRVEDVAADTISWIGTKAGETVSGVGNALDAVSTNTSSKKEYHHNDYLTWEDIRGQGYGEQLWDAARENGYA